MQLTVEQDTEQYQLNWDGKPETLYLFIKRKTPCKSIYGGQMNVDSENCYDEILREVDWNHNKNKRKFAVGQNATYSFEVYDNKNQEGNILASTTCYIGDRRNIDSNFYEFESGFSRLELSADFKISPNYFWLRFKNDKFSKMPFYLPEMIKNGNKYVTSCLLKQDAPDYLEVGIDPKVNDFLYVSGNFKR